MKKKCYLREYCLTDYFCVYFGVDISNYKGCFNQYNEYFEGGIDALEIPLL
jgi:hypothetical protein